MTAPPNPARYGETWPQYKIDYALEAINGLKPFVVLSGGFAWHFMAPAGHVEYKHAHDHKDVDIYIPKQNIATVMALLPAMNFEKVRTKHDSADFRRYEQFVDDGVHSHFKITLDLFDGDVDSIVTPSGWQVVRPDVLVSFYKTHHSSIYCWAVQATKALLENGELPENLIGNLYLTQCPDLDEFLCTKCGWVTQFPEYFGFTQYKKMHLCPNCNKYVPKNMGKPTYKTQAKQEQEVADFIKEMK
jgi:hypothetical protein